MNTPCFPPRFLHRAERPDRSFCVFMGLNVEDPERWPCIRDHHKRFQRFIGFSRVIILYQHQQEFALQRLFTALHRIRCVCASLAVVYGSAQIRCVCAPAGFRGVRFTGMAGWRLGHGGED